MGSEDKQYVYDEIVIENKVYKFRAGEDNFINDMISYFPNEKQAIIKYVELIKNCKENNFIKLILIQNRRLVLYLLSYFLGSEYYNFVTKSAYDTIKELTKNELLISVLCGQFGDYEVLLKKSSFFIHAVL